MKIGLWQSMILGVIIVSPLCAFCGIPHPGSISNELHPDLDLRLSLNVSEFGYSKEASSLVSKWVLAWDVKPGVSLINYCFEALDKSKRAYETGELSEKKWCRSQEKTASKIAEYLHSKTTYNEQYYDLTDVVIKKQGQCLGLTQLYYVVGKAVGLEIVPILVLPDYKTVAREHVACLVQISESKYVQIDLTSNITSLPFTFHTHYASEGDHDCLIDTGNRLGLYQKIQRLDYHGLRALVCNARARDCEADHNSEQAISLFSDAIELNPNYASAWANRAIVYLNLGDPQIALQDIDHAIDLYPEMPEAFNTRGLILSKKQDYENAIQAFNTAIQLNSRFAKAYNNRGVNYWKLGQYEKSIRDYSEALRLKSDYVSAYVNRATVYGYMERYEEAVRDCSLAIQYAPACYQAYQSRGLWYGKLDKKERAQDDLLYAQALKGPLE
ncbi:MAG: tetratricopeptide repeat protein [Phycisphaerae bacterium]|nr:tetratricopeptide repeat protein [Phycisphaerae bacterium]